jgi:hypothetical protein
LDNAPDFDNIKKSEVEYGNEKIEYLDYTDIPRKYIVNDDNLPPYRKINLDNPVEHYSDKPDYEKCEITSVVVPLYKKIYLEVTKARELALTILTDIDFGFKFQPGFVFRFFLASGRSFKEHISRLPSLDATQKDYVILARMPKFIWCAELYERADFQDDKAAGLLIIDATEANQISNDSLIFAGYPDRILVKNEGNFVILRENFNLYKRFKNNLE